MFYKMPEWILSSNTRLSKYFVLTNIIIKEMVAANESNFL